MYSKKLLSDFRFGFEFEGFAQISSYDYMLPSPFEYDINSYDELECNGLSDDDYDNFYDEVNNYINNHFHVTSGRTHYDGSLHNYDNGCQSFEYSSPVFKFAPYNFKKLKSFFKDIDYHDMGINKTCGFHTHISFKGMTEEDAIWIICQLAMNDSYVYELTHMNINNEILDFYNEKYANKAFFEDIKSAIQNHDYNKLVEIINDDKYRVLRIHPQGTLEWRGPRNFLNKTNGIDIYIQKLYSVVKIIRDCLSKQTINNNTKKSFFKVLKEYKKDVYYDGYLFKNTNKRIIRNHVYGLLTKFGKVNNFYIDSKKVKYIVDHPWEIVSEDWYPYSSVIKKYMNETDQEKFMKNLNKDNNCHKNELEMFYLFPKIMTNLSSSSLSAMPIKEKWYIIESLDYYNYSEEEQFNLLSKILKSETSIFNKQKIIECINNSVNKNVINKLNLITLFY